MCGEIRAICVRIAMLLCGIMIRYPSVYMEMDTILLLCLAMDSDVVFDGIAILASSCLSLNFLSFFNLLVALHNKE